MRQGPTGAPSSPLLFANDFGDACFAASKRGWNPNRGRARCRKGQFPRLPACRTGGLDGILGSTSPWEKGL